MDLMSYHGLKLDVVYRVLGLSISIFFIHNISQQFLYSTSMSNHVLLFLSR